MVKMTTKSGDMTRKIIDFVKRGRQIMLNGYSAMLVKGGGRLGLRFNV